MRRLSARRSARSPNRFGLDVAIYYSNPPDGPLRGPAIRYEYKPPGGVWTEPQDIDPSDAAPLYISLALASDGTPHIVYGTETTAGIQVLRHAYRLPDGTWSSPAAIPTAETRAFEPRVAIDDHDTLHVVFGTPDGVRYARLARGSTTWTESRVGTTSPSWVTLALGRDGTVHVAYTSGRTVTYASRSPTVEEFTAHTVYSDPVASFVDDQQGLAVDAAGAVHLTYRASTAFHEAVRDPEGEWSDSPVHGVIGGAYSATVIEEERVVDVATSDVENRTSAASCCSIARSWVRGRSASGEHRSRARRRREGASAAL